MMKRLGLPVLALLGALAFAGASSAQAGVRFGVTVGPPHPPGYVYPQPYVAPYDYGYYSTYPPAYGYYDYGYRHGHRDHGYWEHHRREWREHERYEHDRYHDHRR